MKKLLVFLFAILIALGYSACGGGYSSPTAPSTASGNGPTPTPGGGY